MKYQKFLSLLLAICLVLPLLPIITSAESAAVSDTVTAAAFPATDTNYMDFTGIRFSSDAVYAGSTAQTADGAVQLRNTNNAGIVTTSSGGRAAKVAVTWNYETPEGSTLEVYGKNTMYNASADLYDDNAGTQIGTLVYGTNDELVISGDYAFIGLRTSSKKAYLDEIEITWDAESAVQLPDGFYLIGPDWSVGAIDETEKFGANLNASGEYMLEATLGVNDQIKVVKVKNGAITAWYPEGLDNQYVVDSTHAGDVTIYFRELYQNAWAAFGGYFYVEADHAIHCPACAHGLVSTAAPRAAAGTTVTITVEPEAEYSLEKLIVLQGGTAVETRRVNDTEYTFVMPAGDVTITATFVKTAELPKFKTLNLVLSGQIGMNFYLDLSMLSEEQKANS